MPPEPSGVAVVTPEDRARTSRRRDGDDWHLGRALRLGLLNFGERSSATVQHWQPNTAVQGPQPVSPPSAAPPSQRLQELEALRTSGAISDTEYAERRAGIISGI